MTADFVYLITSDRIGSQDQELGSRLMHTFFMKLIQAERLPSHILLLERGVQLLKTDSLALDPIKLLAERGTEVWACQTCLEYYGIKDTIAAGRVSDMPDIIKAMQAAAKVIHL